MITQYITNIKYNLNEIFFDNYNEDVFGGFTELEGESLGVISTFLVSFIALTAPFGNEYKKNKNILKLIDAELKMNRFYIEKAGGMIKNPIIIPSGMEDSWGVEIKKLDCISLKKWNEFKFNVAVFGLEKFKEYEFEMVYIEEIMNFTKTVKNNVGFDRERAKTELSYAIENYKDYIKSKKNKD